MRRRRIAESASQKTMTTTSYHPNSQKTHTPNATHSRDCKTQFQEHSRDFKTRVQKIALFQNFILSTQKGFIVNDYPSSSTGKRKRLSDRRREYLDLFPSWVSLRFASLVTHLLFSIWNWIAKFEIDGSNHIFESSDLDCLLKFIFFFIIKLRPFYIDGIKLKVFCLFR